MVHLIRIQATSEQIDEMLQILQTYIKLAVDIRQEVLAGGGEMHADARKYCLIVAANKWIFGALIGIPHQKKLSMSR